MELIAFGAMISIILFHITTNDNINGILPLLSIYALAAFKLLPAFQQIYASIGQIKGNISAFESIKEDLLKTKNISEEIFKNEIQTKEINLKDQIHLNSIYFTYPNKQKAVLNNISLTIPSNSVVGIVGPSGSGKTTLIDVLLGLIQPEKGNLEIDKTIINKDNIVSWQKNIGYVPQDIFLSEESIAENIAFGIPKKLIDYERINKAIKLSHLDSLINSLEGGLSTMVGERGVQLSGGQRQRIGIARALYHKTNVFIFDEATSSLDGITEKSIMNAINDFKGNKTIILVAHRLKTIKNCDIIFFIEDGKLIDKGTYDELITKNLDFKKMTKYA
jgi:ATP-binding cassette, subfamily B, bacterial PglK